MIRKGCFVSNGKLWTTSTQNYSFLVYGLVVQQKKTEECFFPENGNDKDSLDKK